MVGIVLGSYFLVVLLLFIPAVQSGVSSIVANALSKKLSTSVYIGRIDVGLLNRLILKDVCINDQSGRPMLRVGLISAKFKVSPLVQGKVIISTAQLFDFQALLYQESEKTPPNYQFVIDAFASKDTTRHSNPDLRINTLLVRRGTVRYDRWFVPPTKGRFNMGHLLISNLSANIVVKALRNDSLNAKLKKFHFDEQSGLHLNGLSFYVTANRREALLSKLHLVMPGTDLRIDSIRTRYLWNKHIEWKTLRFGGRVQLSTVTLSDMAAFVPKLKSFDAPVRLSTNVEGTSDNIMLRAFTLSDDNRDINLLADISLNHYNSADGLTPRLNASIRQVDINSTGWRFIFRNINSTRPEVPAYISRLGNVHYRGMVGATPYDFKMSGSMSTGLGNVTTDFVGRTGGRFNASVKSLGFELGKLLGPQTKLGRIGLNVRANGVLKGRDSAIKATGVVSELSYANYTYHNIAVDGTYTAGMIEGLFNLDDPNGQIEATGKMNLLARTPIFDVRATVRHLKPHTLNLTSSYPDTEFSGDVIANFRGNNVDNLDGLVELRDFIMTSHSDSYRLDTLALVAKHLKGHKELTLNSDFVKAEVHGNFTYASFVSHVRQLVHSYLPSLVAAKEVKTEKGGTIEFSVNVLKSDALRHFTGISLDIEKPCSFNGYYKDTPNGFFVTGTVPDFIYSGSHYRDASLVAVGSADSMNLHLQTNKIGENKMLALELSATAKQDRLFTTLKWDNCKEKLAYSGMLKCQTRFHRDAEKRLSISVGVNPSQMVINDSVWQIHPSQIDYKNKQLEVHNFLVEHKKQHLGINGLVSRSAEDSLVADLRDIDLEYVFDIVNFHTVDFAGKATGKVYASQILSSPSIDTHLSVPDFTFNRGVMGVLSAYAKWDKEQKAVVFDALCNDVSARSQTTIKGAVTPGKGIDIHIQANRTNLYFLNHFTSGIFTDFEGRVTGWVRVFGPFHGINLEGEALVNEASTKVNSLNTSYTLWNDSVHITPGLILFNNDSVYDREGKLGKPEHRAFVTGRLMHNNLSHLSFQFNIKGDNVLAYDWRDFGDGVFCGTVYGTGSVLLQGRPGNVDIDVNARPNARTVCTYNSATPEAISDGQFVHFVSHRKDTTALIAKGGDADSKKSGKEDDDMASDLRMNFLLDVNPDATMKIIMDPNSGDYINLNGSGNIRANYYNKGRFQMFGTYTVDHGIYKLSLQDVIHKDFQFQRGGTILFGGIPRQADLNLQAVHTVNSVSLNDLSQGMFSQNNVRVNCIMNLGGKASAPVVTFDLDLPNSNEDEKQMVRSLISTNEEKNLQIIYLLGIGRFYTDEANRANQDQSQSSVAMNSLLSSTLSGQLNQVLSNAIHSNNWNFGTNLSTGEKGWSDMDVEGLLSGKLLNNRLLINGNFGYRESQTSTTTFVGDFDLQWLLTKNGSVSLKAYNETNDRYFTKSSLTTQGIGFIMKKDFNSWWDLFRITHKKKK